MNETKSCIVKTLENNKYTYLPQKILKRKCGDKTKKALKKLEDEGILVSKGKKYALSKRAGYIRGIFDGKEEGYGFLMPTEDMRDLFIPPNQTGTALNGDLILAKKTKKSRGRWKAKFEKVIERARDNFVGKMVRMEGNLFFEPQDKNIPYLFEVKNTEDLNEGDFVLVEFIKWTTYKLPPLARFKRKIDKKNIYDIIIKQEYNLSHDFPEKALQEARSAPDLSLEGREDFTHLDTITIDPEDAKDLDDAITVKKENGKYLVWVHIADVSALVEKDSAMDREAYRRGCTTYLPDDTYFMLPPEITDKLSLSEEKDSPAITTYIEFDKNGEPGERKFYKSIIKSDCRMDYRQAQEIIEDKRQSEYSKMLKNASELAEILANRRDREGYLDFYREEIKIKFENSKPVDILPRRELWTHRIIEQLMVSANEVVAERLEKNKLPGIYRVHEEPDSAKLKDFKELVNSLGLNLESINRQDLSEFLERIEEKPYERILNYELLRCMKRARYIARPEPHYGLASKLYTHFTSPIRRYPDLVVHRLLFGEHYTQEELKNIADRSTEQEWKADEAEREITKFYTLRYLQDNMKKEYRGLIVDIVPDGIWVELDDLLVKGFVPVKLLPPDNYQYGEHELTGSRHNFVEGSLVLTEIYNVSPETGELILDYSGTIEKDSKI